VDVVEGRDLHDRRTAYVPTACGSK
jgi:hypothetical protein